MKVLLNEYKLRKAVHLTLLVFVLVYVISGLGIVYSSIIEKITFGLLTKSLSFKIHFYLLIPFLIVLALHIIMTKVNLGNYFQFKQKEVKK